MKVIGLTGGIASGKSTVSKMLRDESIYIIDADIIAREVVEIGSNALIEIENEFGIEVINDDGSLNRKLLGSIVFKDKDKLKKLNAITHPKIREKINRRIEELRELGEKLCVVDAALLIEAGFVTLVDYVMLIYVSKEVQLKRLMDRDELSADEACNRVKSQLNYEEKKKFADFIIDNSYDIEYTRSQVLKVLDEIKILEDING